MRLSRGCASRYNLQLHVHAAYNALNIQQNEAARSQPMWVASILPIHPGKPRAAYARRTRSTSSFVWGKRTHTGYSSSANARVNFLKNFRAVDAEIPLDKGQRRKKLQSLDDAGTICHTSKDKPRCIWLTGREYGERSRPAAPEGYEDDRAVRL